MFNSALIGYSGFVGSNLRSQGEFDSLYNSKNINDIKDREFDLIVCAGVSAVKWWANANPLEDKKAIDDLAEKLRHVKCKSFVLISTIDVYNNPIQVDENTEIDKSLCSPYGLNRLLLEETIIEMFPDYRIIRLPGLFGDGLKKNYIYDLINSNMLEKINLASSFQWYPLDKIYADLKLILQEPKGIFNFVTEPLPTDRLKDTFFTNSDACLYDADNAIHYNVLSSKFKVEDKSYLMSADHVITHINDWLVRSNLK